MKVWVVENEVLVQTEIYEMKFQVNCLIFPYTRG